MTVEDYDAARGAYAELEEEVAAASLSVRARRTATRALRDLEEGTSPDAYWRAPTWKRVAVIAAGPAANIVAAFLILFVMFGTSGGPTSKATRQVAAVEARTPAAHAGLRHGDLIVAVDGKPTQTFAAVSHLIRGSRGAPITLTVIRNGQRLRLGPKGTVRSHGRWIWGFQPAAEIVRYPVGQAASSAAHDLWHVVTDTGSGIASLVRSHSRGQLSGPIGIVRAGHAELQQGVTWYLGLLAFVSMSLALLNLVPVLPLDGGHILFSLIESVRRRAVAREVYERVSLVGLALILLVFVIALQNDTRHLFG